MRNATRKFSETRKWPTLAVALFSAQSALAASPSNSTYTDIKAFLQSLAAQYPSTTQLITIGDSDSGETIQGLRIGNGATKNLVVGTHHGNEYGSTEVAKGFAAAAAANPIQGQTLFVIPVLNISGYNSKVRYETKKGETLDANRDYPGPCGTEGPFKLKSTAALADFVARENIVTSATLHTYSPAVLFPWGVSTHDTQTFYKDLFVSLGQAATVESNYAVGNSTELLYPADGTFEDYAFWKHGMWSMLFEMGRTHSPSDTAVAELVRVNVPGLRRMFEQAPTQRAERHEFEGKCDLRLQALDRHDE